MCSGTFISTEEFVFWYVHINGGVVCSGTFISAEELCVLVRSYQRRSCVLWYVHINGGVVCFVTFISTFGGKSAAFILHFYRAYGTLLSQFIIPKPITFFLLILLLEWHGSPRRPLASPLFRLRMFPASSNLPRPLTFSSNEQSVLLLTPLLSRGFPTSLLAQNFPFRTSVGILALSIGAI